MTQFYLPPDRWNAQDPAARLEGDEARHARDVFRLKEGDAIRLFDGAGNAAQGRIRTVDRTFLDIRIEQRLPSEPVSGVALHLAQALVPNETMDQVVRQATELGVAQIWPLACERSVVRLDADKRAAKQEHWKKTALAACKQCDRNTLPMVQPVLTAKELAARFAEFDAALVACPQETENGLDIWNHRPQRPASVLLLIGPEGDFTPAEIGLFKEKGARTVTLGPLILKSDTAAVTALAVLQHLIRATRTR